MTIRRMKTYTGGQGYVYQYYFVGKRPAEQGSHSSAATEYIFDVTSDRKTTFSVSVFCRAGRAPGLGSDARPRPRRSRAVCCCQNASFPGIRRGRRYDGRMAATSPSIEAGLEAAFSTLGVE